MIKKCARCGSEFDGYHSAKYCSPECRKASRLEGRRRRYHANIKIERAKSVRRYHIRCSGKAPLIKSCEKCGGEFEAKTNAKYCPKCRKVKNLEAVRRYQAAHPEKVKAARRRWREQNRSRRLEGARHNQPYKSHPPRIKLCEKCGSEFETKTNAKYCPTCGNNEREYKRRYREEHREQIREYDRQRYEQQRLKRERQRIIEKLFARRKRT